MRIKHLIITGVLALILILVYSEGKRYEKYKDEHISLSYSILSKLQTFFSHNYYYPDSLQELIEFGFTMEEYSAETLERLSKYSIKIVKNDSGIFVLQTNPKKEFKFEYIDQLTYFDFLLGTKNIFLCFTEPASVPRSVLGASNGLGEFFIGKKVIRDDEIRQQLTRDFTKRLKSGFKAHDNTSYYIVVFRYSRESELNVAWSNPPMDTAVVNYQPLFDEMTGYSENLFSAFNIDSAFVIAKLPVEFLLNLNR